MGPARASGPVLDHRKTCEPCATGRKIVTKETQEGCLSFFDKLGPARASGPVFCIYFFSLAELFRLLKMTRATMVAM